MTARQRQRRIMRSQHEGRALVSVAVVERTETGEREAYIVGRTVPEGESVYARLGILRHGGRWYLVKPEGDTVDFRSVADALRWMAGWGTGALMARVDALVASEVAR